ncbi:MAG: hypothetical protein LBJ08_03710 [Bifidobacteriaceae bacterium]|nr:hypothetical protein [Bifidobacteriaceae bacterium]
MNQPERPRVVIGPSGAGKTALAEALTRVNSRFELVLTHTTRPRRPREGATHVFVTDPEFDSTPYLGTLSIFGARYGLPNFATGRTPLILLRLAALDQFAPLYPNAFVIQVEASVDTLIERLAQRGDLVRADPEALREETLRGREVASAIVQTDTPFSQSLDRFAAAATSLSVVS